MKSPVLKKKVVKEKATGEMYPSKKAMMKHEKSESKAEMKKEYGRVKSPAKQTMGAAGLGAGTKEGKYITKKVGQAAKAYVKFSKDLDAQADRRGATQLRSVNKTQVSSKKSNDKNVKTGADKKVPAKMKKY